MAGDDGDNSAAWKWAAFLTTVLLVGIMLVVVLALVLTGVMEGIERAPPPAGLASF